MRFTRITIATALAIAAVIAAFVSPSFAKPVEEALVVHFTYGSTNLQRLFELEDQLEKAIAKAGVGEYDGNEVAVDGSDGYLYMYGPSADRLFEVVRPVLESTSFMKGAKVKKRYGPPEPGVKESVLVLQPKP